MNHAAQRRDKLLRQTARVYGSAGLIASFACLSTPTTLGTVPYWFALPLYAAALVLILLLDTKHATAFVVAVTTIGIAIAFLLGFSFDVVPPSGEIAILAITSMAVPGTALVLVRDTSGWFSFLGASVLVGTVAAAALTRGGEWQHIALFNLIGMIAAAFWGGIITTSIGPAMRQVAEIGRAHRIERQASELEAQRRQGARLLHDTVLATLTLLAHSGRGVSSEALRNQARNDAHLLRQLRLGEPLLALPEAGYRPDLVEETLLGTTLDSVKERFDQLGLEVNWHGTGRLLLPQGVLDGFLFAISECLENVRRHAGVPVAHVTISEDEHMVRAMITDAGVGFSLESVESQRLGIKDSVIGRMAELGGNAKFFSAPGAGTTVLLEVPR